VYADEVPRLWKDTVEEHRRSVRDTTLDAVADIVAGHGLTAVTMSRIAETAGIGRATLYKYFPDVDAVLLAWHERQIAAHLEQLTHIRDQADGPGRRITAVLTAYAGIRRGQHSADVAAVLHRGDHVAHATRHLQYLIQDLLAEGVVTGDVRDDIPPAELAAYCIHALSASADLPSEAAVRRLVVVTLDGLRPAAQAGGAAS
jgi:AcrR family transcriptional regulator